MGTILVCRCDSNMPQAEPDIRWFQGKQVVLRRWCVGDLYKLTRHVRLHLVEFLKNSSQFSQRNHAAHANIVRYTGLKAICVIFGKFPPTLEFS